MHFTCVNAGMCKGLLHLLIVLLPFLDPNKTNNKIYIYIFSCKVLTLMEAPIQLNLKSFLL